MLLNNDPLQSGGVGDGIVYGTAAAVLFTVQALLSLPPVRRRCWELFKLAHMTLFPAALALSIIHARWMLPFVAIPIGLYVFDSLLRWRIAAVSFPATFTALPGGITRVEIAVNGRVAVAPGQHVLLNVPVLSLFEWHPFSVTNAEPRPESITLLVKAR